MIAADNFQAAILEAGLSPPEYIEPGRIHRFPGLDKVTRNTAGWCRLFEDQSGGVFGDYSTGLREVWQSGEVSGQPPRTPTPRPTPKPAPESNQYAVSLWETAGAGVGSHPYAVPKGIHWDAGALRGRVSGRVVGKDADCIVVPIRDIRTARVFAIQAINPQGKKQTFGPLKGRGLLLGNTLDKSPPWYVAEGWATAVSMVFHHHRGNAVCGVAFGQSNLRILAEHIAQAHAPDRIAILREHDA